MNEYKFLSIDRFDGVNLSSTAFFLSHCHADHMVGLAESEFFERLESRKNNRLYCSEVTKGLLLADDRYSRLEEHVYTLKIDRPTIIEADSLEDPKELERVSVTLLHAGHCPGSVMFLFEGEEGNVLYTGDFRLPKFAAKRMRPLHLYNGQKKIFKSMYVDTTFCRPNAVFIPSREDCLRSMQVVISDWLKKDRSNAVRLNLSAKYGYEYLFHELYKQFGKKIYCRRKKQYQCLPNTYEALTDNPEWARIFACFKREKIGKPSHWKTLDEDETVPERLNFLKITLSTMYFTYEALPHQIYERMSKDHYRFCYSFHSSYSEVCDFVKYVNPKNVFANVIPSDGLSLEEVARDLATRCGFKSDSNDTFLPKMIKFPTLPKSAYESKPALPKTNLKKRVLSFSDSDDNSQEFWEKILSKAKKRDAEIKAEFYGAQDNQVTEMAAQSSLKEFPSVAASPNSKAPRQSEIDALHIRLASNDIPSFK